jgi:hypothetical protein
MRSKALRLLNRFGVILVVIAITLLAVRAYDSQRGPPLELWHTYVPHDLSQDDIRGLDWAGYVKAENALFGRAPSEPANAAK